MAGEIERHGLGDQRSAELVERYAGVAAAEHLSEQEKLAAVASLVPMALQVVAEARDTIERLNTEVEALRAQEAANTVDAEVEAERPQRGGPRPLPPLDPGEEHRAGRHAPRPGGNQVARHAEIVVVGAGQSGLSVSAALTRAGRDHVVLERGRIGQSWRTRWDSFRLVAPAWSIRLYGRSYDGPDPDGFPRREEVVQHLERYAAMEAAPVLEEVGVEQVVPLADGGFRVETSDGPLQTRQVVLA